MLQLQFHASKPISHSAFISWVVSRTTSMWQSCEICHKTLHRIKCRSRQHLIIFVILCEVHCPRPSCPVKPARRQPIWKRDFASWCPRSRIRVPLCLSTRDKGQYSATLTLHRHLIRDHPGNALLPVTSCMKPQITKPVSAQHHVHCAMTMWGCGHDWE